MANYVLVRGGDRNGSMWNDVAQLLSIHNHNLFCLTMVSIKKTTLQHNIDEVCKIVHSENLDNIILVGHSYGAMVITGVADKLPAKISCMVYIDSAVPGKRKIIIRIICRKRF